MSPGFDDRLGVGHAREPVLVEALIAEPAVERFDLGVLIGCARFDQAQSDTAFMRPGQHGSAAELLGILRAQHPREATDTRTAVEGPGHRSSPAGASGDDGNRFGRGIIDTRQTRDHASIGRSVEHDVGGPHVVGCLRAHQGLSTGDRDLLPSSASDLQLGFGVQPLDAFVVHPMTGAPPPLSGSAPPPPTRLRGIAPALRAAPRPATGRDRKRAGH